ncbi:DUF1702 family protein [Roseibium sp. AS2]|uniref:DUF1702 family protein n=1 Tax=Roseibium sp. AS2 TaxID=3135781 RepID=UPI00317D1B74
MDTARQLTHVADTGLNFSRFLRIEAGETSLERRGFIANSAEAKDRLEAVGAAFLAGYHALIGPDPFTAYSRALAGRPPDLQGFLAEGAAMGAALRDTLSFQPWRLAGLREVSGPRFDYLIHVGTGWAVARLGWFRSRIWKNLDPLLIPLSVDGWGFHDIYFSRPGVLTGKRPRLPHGLDAAYDQGIGRGLWFASGGSAAAASAIIETQAAGHRPDLVAGLSLAMAYCGPAQAADWRFLAERFPKLRDHMAQGVAFAASARTDDGSGSDENLMIASGETCGAGTAALARTVTVTCPDRGTDRSLSEGWKDYQAWRARLRSTLSIPLVQTEDE